MVLIMENLQGGLSLRLSRVTGQTYLEVCHVCGNLCLRLIEHLFLLLADRAGGSTRGSLWFFLGGVVLHLYILLSRWILVFLLGRGFLRLGNGHFHHGRVELEWIFT